MLSSQTILFSLFFILLSLCLVRSEMEPASELIDYNENPVVQDARLPIYMGGANGYQKRWANQVRFGKRGSSWASSVRFG